LREKIRNLFSVEFATVFVFAVVKSYLFYSFIGIREKRILLTLLTLAFIILIHLSCRKMIAARVFQIVVSSLMFADVLHYRYFHQTITLQTVKFITQLPAVKGSVTQLISPEVFLLFLDIPVSMYVHRKFKGNKVQKGPLILIPLALVLLFSVVNLEPFKVINSQEFFTYHLNDLYRSMSGDPGNEVLALSINDLPARKGEPAKNHLFGVAGGKNLIVIQVESFQNLVINRTYNGQELTPVLNKLLQKDTLYFNNYYQQLGRGNTSDAEFVSQNSLYAPMHGQAYDIYSDKEFYGLPWILREQGYKTVLLHGYKKEYWNREKAYRGQGFEEFISEENFAINEIIGMGISDKEFLRQSVTYLQGLGEPFYSFLITLTSHGPFIIPDEYATIRLLPDDQGTLFGSYLQAVAYVDYAIGEFIKYLQEAGLYENSVIAIYGDHFGLNCKDKSIHDNVSNFLGFSYDYDEMLKVPLIIHIPGLGRQETIETTGGQIDFLPTILNLIGIDNPNPFVFGQDLLNAGQGFVASQTYMLKGSFISDDIIFEVSRDGIYKNSRAWNRKTGEAVPLEECRMGYEKAVEDINKCMFVLENNLIKRQ